MDQNGVVSPPPLQGQLPACTMEKVKEESVSVALCVRVCVCVVTVETMVETASIQHSDM